MLDFIVLFLTVGIPLSSALLLAALGETVNQRSGVFNLGCEGVMSMGAFVGMLIPFMVGGAGKVAWVVNLAGLLAAALSSGKFVISALYLGLLASVGAYMLSNYALARLPVARMAIFSSCSTVISVLSGVIIMHDEFPLINVLAFVLMLAGVWGVNHYERPAA